MDVLHLLVTNTPLVLSFLGDDDGLLITLVYIQLFAI